MARVKAEREVHISAIGCPVVGGMAKVVLHIPTPNVKLWVHVGELAKDSLRTLSHNVGQHVESAAMSHSHHDVADFMRGGPLDSHFQKWDQAFRSFQRKAFGS